MFGAIKATARFDRAVKKMGKKIMGMDWGVRPARKPARFRRVLAAAALVAGLYPQAAAFAGDSVSAPDRALSLESKDAIANPSPNLANLPRGASAGWWSDVQRELAEYEYRPSQNAEGLQAPNRAHNLRTYFGPRGIRLHDRTAAGSPELVKLSLIGTGRGAALAPVAAGTVTHSGTRVEIRRPGIVEWYENTAQGLEQGFTLADRAKGEGPLVLELAVEHARVRLIGTSIELATDSGRRLHYGKLIAEDATGRILVSHIEALAPNRLRLVIDDSGASYPLVIDPLITGVPDTILESNQLGSSGIKPSAFGVSVSGAGDVNGDGFGDVIVGAWGWDGGENEEGAAFVFLGGLTGIQGSDPATAFARIESNQAAARLGRSVSGAGDVDGDGFDDIVVGAYLYRSTAFFEGWGDLAVNGAAFVYLGSTAGIQGAADPSLANAGIISNELDSFLGWTVSGAGDIDGDGFDDIIVGAPRAGIPFPSNIPPNDRQGNGGAALVFLGSAAGITGTGFSDAHKVLLPYPPGFPELVGGEMGISVSAAGDVNGDGFADVVLGMTGSGGAAMVFTGSATGIVGDDPSGAHAMIVSDATTPIGQIVSGAGDVNGDGFADIILGAPGFPIPEPGFSPSNRGAILVFLGSAQGITATGPAGAQAMFEGTMAGDLLGWDVSAAGDVDGDGFDDVIAAALGYAGGLDQEGAAYVFRGGPDGIVGTSLRDDAYVRIESGQSRAAMNTVDIALSASGIGDVNGDGFADVMLGTGFYDNGEENEGAAFVYHGGFAPAIPNQPPVPVAGADQTVFDTDNSGSETITLDGSASFDPEGSTLSYAWFEGETLLGTSPVLTTALSTTGLHTLVLKVTDDGGLTRGDPVDIFVGLVDRPLVSFDDFSSGGFAGGFGWAGDWIIGGDVSLSSVDTFPTPPQARIGAGGTLSRAAPLPAGATGLMVSFWAKASQFGPSDQVAVQVPGPSPTSSRQSTSSRQTLTRSMRPT